MNKIYLVEVSISNRYGFEKKMLIEEGTITEIKKRFVDNTPLRFFKIEEVENDM